MAVNIIDPHSYGIDFYGDNLFTTEMEIAGHPERVQKVIRATLKGWAYALENKDEIIDLIQKKYNPDLDRDQLRYEAKVIDQMILPDLVPMGDINPRRYERIAEIYHRLGMSQSSTVPDGFIYTARPDPAVSLTDEEQAWLDAHPEITLGTDPGFRPYVFQNKDGSVSGVEADFVRRINEISGANIRISLGKWSEIVEKAMNREIDGLTTSIHTKERARYFLFSDTYRNSYLYIYTHKQLFAEIRKMEDLIGKRVGLPKRMLAFERALKRTPGIIPVYTESLEESYRMLLDEEVDAIIGGNSIHLTLTENMIPYYGVAFVVPDSRANIIFSVRKDWPELRSIINKSLAAIPKEERLAILKKWGGNYLGNSGGSVPEVAPTQEEQGWLDRNHSVRVSLVDFPPFINATKGEEPTGMSIDHLNLISDRTGIRFTYNFSTLPFAEALERMKNQEGPDLIYDLSPPQLNEIGLSAAISEWLEEQVEKKYALKAECIVSGSEGPMGDDVRVILFRSVRELVTNVIKHSRSTMVKIRVNQDHDRVKVSVRDDGAGFDADAKSQSLKTEAGFGLFSIKEQMADLGGSLEIVSESGKGTEAILAVPLVFS